MDALITVPCGRTRLVPLMSYFEVHIRRQKQPIPGPFDVVLSRPLGPVDFPFVVFGCYQVCCGDGRFFFFSPAGRPGQLVALPVGLALLTCPAWPSLLPSSPNPELKLLAILSLFNAITSTTATAAADADPCPVVEPPRPYPLPQDEGGRHCGGGAHPADAPPQVPPGSPRCASERGFLCFLCFLCARGGVSAYVPYLCSVFFSVCSSETREK